MAVELAFQLRYAAALDQRLAFGDPADNKAYQKQEKEKQDHTQRRAGKRKNPMAQRLGSAQYRTVSDCGKCSKNADHKAFADKDNMFAFPGHDGYPHDNELCEKLRILCRKPAKMHLFLLKIP
jgi:hypothetical protein